VATVVGGLGGCLDLAETGPYGGVIAIIWLDQKVGRKQDELKGQM
jgi:hypothetical protein